MENMSESEAWSSIDHDFSTSKNILSHLLVIRLVATEEKAAAYRRERAQEEEQEEYFKIV